MRAAAHAGGVILSPAAIHSAGREANIGRCAVRKVLFIFSTLSDGDVEWLASTGERINLEAGSVLIPVGSRIDYLYFVLDGRLMVKTRAGDPIATLESGEILGEMSLVDPAPTAVSVEVLTEATVLRLADSVVREKLASDPGFAARFYRALCVFLAHRLRETTTRFGYGKASEEKDARDELNEDLLDTVHLAGARFERMLKRLAG
jgi:CRP-like cAMP-binding protein